MILQRTILDPITGVCILVGQGAPTLDAPTGSLYIRRDGTENNTIYSKYGSGTGDWTALGSVASSVDWSSLTNIPSNLVSGSSQVDHNATTNYVANRHIDHSAVSISAGNGLSGGGNITATSTLTLDTGSAHFTNGVKAKLNTDGIVSSSAQIDHNSTTNYSANRHIDHSAVSISAGNGMSGGGTIASTRTLTLNTASAHFTDGVRAKLNADNIYPSSSLVGIGTTSPSTKLDVAGDIRTINSVIINSTAPTLVLQDSDHRSAMVHVNSNIFYVLRGDGTNSTSWAQFGGYWPLTINLENNNAEFGGTLSSSGSLFVGTGNIHLGGQLLATYDSSYNHLRRRDGGIGIYLGGADPANYYDNSAHFFRDRSSNVRMTIDTAGNLGLGVTPSAWDASYKALTINGFSVGSQGASGGSEVTKNSYVSSGGTQRYVEDGFASKYEQVTGIHKWFTAPSGTAGNAISFTERARITADGNFIVDTNTLYVDAVNNRVGIGTASPVAPLDVKGISNGLQARFGNIAGRGLEISTAANGGITEGISVLNARGTTSGILVFQTQNTERARIDASGNLLVGGTSTIYPTANRGIVEVNGSSQALYGMGVGGTGAAYVLHDGTNMSVWQERNGYMRFGTNGTERARITAGGDVGIGTTDPNAKLSVNGNANITGSLGIRAGGIDLYGNTSGIISLAVPAAAGSNTITFPASTGTVALTSQLPSVNNGTLTVQGSGGVTGTGTFTANQSTNATITLSHADTSTLTGIQGTNGIASITVDSLGHVTAVNTASYVDTSNNQTVGGNKTFSGDVLIADKIVHSGDTNTAIRFPSADTFTVETSGTERIRVTSTGLVGIGVSPSYKLHVSGSIYATENITAYSDGRIKENVVTIDNALDKVDKMRGVYYTRVDSDGTERHVGVIAQEVLEVVPELVSYAQDIDQYGVKYQNITALLIQAIKELKKEIDVLKENK